MSMKKYKDELPDILKAAYKMLLDYVTLENMKDLLTCMKYMKDSVAGFDLYAIKEASDGSVDITTVKNNGFSDRYNHGLRILLQLLIIWLLEQLIHSMELNYGVCLLHQMQHMNILMLQVKL